MQDYRNIVAWQRAHLIALAVYRLTASYPIEEKYGIVQQLRRAAVSVPSNIAEGSKRAFRRDYVRFLNIAEGSLREVECLLLLSRDLGFGAEQDIVAALRAADIAARILAGLRKSVQRGGGRRNRSSRPPTPNPTPDS